MIHLIFTSLIVAGLHWTTTAAATIPAHCLDQKIPPAQFPVTASTSPRNAFADYDYVFYGRVLVEGRPCSKGFCSGVRVERILKGDDLPPITVVTQGVTEKKCPHLGLTKNDLWLFFGSSVKTKKGTPFIILAPNAPHIATRSPTGIETLQGKYLLYQAKLDQALEKAMKKKMWEK